MASTEFDQLMAQSRAALDQIAKGNADGFKALYSRGDDITLGNPFGGFGHGWDQVVAQMERAASNYRDGATVGFDEIVHADLGDVAYTVEIERLRAKVAGRDEFTDLALRVTCIYRREQDGWKLVHRHADPRVDRQAPDSMIQS